jgi:hypothetical protein
LLTQLRTVAGLRNVFNVSGPRAFVFRDNSAMIAASNWLIAQLDRPFDATAAATTYPMPNGDAIKVYYLHNLVPPKPVQELLTAIRTQARVEHAFASNAPCAIAIYGSTDLIAKADAIVAQHDVPTR